MTEQILGHRYKDSGQTPRWRFTLPLLAIVAFTAVALLTWSKWSSSGAKVTTGDQPHYLVMSSGIVREHTLEQTAPYQREFRERIIYPSGLAREGDDPASVIPDVIAGPNGAYNIHNIGLPLLLSPAYALGGVAAAHGFMVTFSALALVLAWLWLIAFGVPVEARLPAILGMLGLPLLAAASQIYPDIPAGVFASGVLLCIHRLIRERTENKVAATHQGLVLAAACAVAFLPWLQIKFGIASALLGIALLATAWLRYRSVALVVTSTGFMATSALLLFAYNLYAFGKVSGPYSSGAIEFSPMALVVFLGLHIDQNQGFLLQNPTLLIGIPGCVLLFRHHKATAILWLLTYLSFIALNALHPVWYGGDSFSGRFAWSAVVLWLVPTALGCAAIARCSKHMLWTIATLSLAVQGFLWLHYSADTQMLYNKVWAAWISTYPAFYEGAALFLPIFANDTWAFDYPANWAWLIALLGSLTLLLRTKDWGSHKWRLVLAVSTPILLIGLYATVSYRPAVIFDAADLPSLTGDPTPPARFAQAGIHPPGYLNYGPYTLLTPGQYKAIFNFQSAAEVNQDIGLVDVYQQSNDTILAQQAIRGAALAPTTVSLTFWVTQTSKVELRTFWRGTADMTLHSIELQALLKQ